MRPLEAAREAACVGIVQARAQDGEGRPVVVVRREHLLGCGPEGGRRDIPDVLAACFVGALEEEEARGAPVVPLGERAHLSRPHDPNEPRLLEHFDVMAHGSLRQAERFRELGDRVRVLAEQDDDPRAQVVPERA
jgi:hypothetical protein